MLDNSCNPISFRYDVHDLVVVQSYSCIFEGVRHYLVNLAYRYMIVWYTCVCSITHWHFFPIVACVVSILPSHIVYYFLLHPWHEIAVYPWNVGHGDISLILKLQTRAALKDHDKSDSSFLYPLEWNDWTLKHIKVNIQNSCTNIVLFSSWYQRFQRDVAPKSITQSPSCKIKIFNILSIRKLASNFNIISVWFRNGINKCPKYRKWIMNETKWKLILVIIYFSSLI